MLSSKLQNGIFTILLSRYCWFWNWIQPKTKKRRVYLAFGLLKDHLILCCNNRSFTKPMGGIPVAFPPPRSNIKLENRRQICNWWKTIWKVNIQSPIFLKLMPEPGDFIEIFLPGNRFSIPKKISTGSQASRVAAQNIPLAPSSTNLGAALPPISVRTYPGQTAFTLVPLYFNCWAICMVNMFRAAFDDE